MKRTYTFFWTLLLACTFSFAAQPRMVNPNIDKEGPFSYLSKPSTSIAMIAANKGAQITFDGAIYTGGVELCFFYGKENTPMMVRQKTLADGYLPIVKSKWTEDDISYQVEAFAMSLDGDPQSNAINFIQVKLKNTTCTKKKVYFSAATRFSGQDHRFEYMRPYNFDKDWSYQFDGNLLVRNNEVIAIYPEGLKKQIIFGIPYKKSFQGSEYHIMKNNVVCPGTFMKKLRSDEEITLIFKIPTLPVSIDQKEFLQAAEKADYDKMRYTCREYWNKTLIADPMVVFPEKKVLEAHYASMMYTLQAIWQNPDKYWIQGVNKFQYRGFWLRDGGYILHNYDVWNQPALTKKLLEIYPKYQSKNGLFSSYKGQLDGVGQAMFSLSDHAIINNDKAYASEVLPLVSNAVDWLIQARKDDPLHIMPETDVKDNEYISGHYTGHNFWALRGLRNAIRLADLVGNKEEKERFSKEYDDYENTFLTLLKKKTGENGAIPPGLDAEGGQDWGNLTGVFPAEVLDPFDPRITATLEKMHKEKYLEGVMSYKGRIHQYLTVKATQNHVFRDEQEAALKDFYAILLHMGSTHEMFEWEATAWGERDTGSNLPPHGWGAAMFNILLRNMMIHERGGNKGLDGRELHLFSVLSPEWVKPGNRIVLRKMPTECGPVLIYALFTEKGMDIYLESKFHTKPENITLHLPWFVSNVTCKSNIDPISQSKDRIVFPSDILNISLEWEKDETVDMSFEKTVTDYRKEYAKRYEKYMKDGGKTYEINAPELKNPVERKDEYDAIYSPQMAGIAVGKPVRSNSEIEPNREPEKAFDGNAKDTNSAWWVGPPAPKWLEVNLEKNEWINEIHVFPHWDNNRYYQYEVEVSLDQHNWTRIIDERKNTTPASPIGHKHQFETVQAKYVRITMHYNSANPYLHLVELKVFRDQKKNNN